MSNENHSQFEHDLAGAAEPEEVEVEQVEVPNNPTRSLRQGLITLYYEYLSRIDSQREKGLIDSEKANELANDVLDLLEKDGLENEIGYTSREKAQEIMGPNMFFGPDEVRKAGIEIREDVPPIPFTSQELERAKELGQMLIYRTSTTMKELNNTFSPKLEKEGKGRLLEDFNWYKDEGFFKSDETQPGWALVSKELNPGSTDKNYLEQSELLVEHLVNKVFKGKPLPGKYQAAVDQFNDQKENIRQLMAGDDDVEWEKGGQMLVDLEINKLTRQSPGEFIYDCLIYFQNTGERLHKTDSIWTNIMESEARLIYLGGFGITGIFIHTQYPESGSSHVGVSFARRGADLKS